MVEIQERSEVFEPIVLGSSGNEDPSLHLKYIKTAPGVIIQGCRPISSSEIEITQECSLGVMQSLIFSNINSIMKQCQAPERNEEINFCIANVSAFIQATGNDRQVLEALENQDIASMENLVSDLIEDNENNPAMVRYLQGLSFVLVQEIKDTYELLKGLKDITLEDIHYVLTQVWTLAATVKNVVLEVGIEGVQDFMVELKEVIAKTPYGAVMAASLVEISQLLSVNAANPYNQGKAIGYMIALFNPTTKGSKLYKTTKKIEGKYIIPLANKNSFVRSIGDFIKDMTKSIKEAKETVLANLSKIHRITLLSKQFRNWKDLSDVKKESLIKELIDASDDIPVVNKKNAHPKKHLGINENGIKKTDAEIKSELQETVDNLKDTDPKKLKDKPPSLTIFHNQEVMLSSMRQWFDEISIKKPGQKQSELIKLMNNSEKGGKMSIDAIDLDIKESLGTGYIYNKETKKIDACIKADVLKVFLKSDQKGGFIIYDLYPKCGK